MDHAPCRHEADTVKILGGVSDLETGQITMLVTFPAATPTAAVLARVRHAIDVHTRPALAAWQRRIAAVWN